MTALNAPAQTFYNSMPSTQQALLISTFIGEGSLVDMPDETMRKWLNGYIATINAQGFSTWNQLSSDQQKSIIENHTLSGPTTVGGQVTQGILGGLVPQIQPGGSRRFVTRIMEVTIGGMLIVIALNALMKKQNITVKVGGKK